MGIEIVQDDVKLLLRVIVDDSVHEIQKLYPSTAFVVIDLYQPCSHLQGGNQGSGAVPLVAMAETSTALLAVLVVAVNREALFSRESAVTQVLASDGRDGAGEGEHEGGL